jgi:ribosome-binding protein aMBF1 (putative translation factor)
MNARPASAGDRDGKTAQDASATGDAIAGAFGRAVRRAREARGWSQEWLAERAELNRSYLGEVERGNAMPSLVTIAKLAHAFELSASALLSRCEGELAIAEPSGGR